MYLIEAERLTLVDTGIGSARGLLAVEAAIEGRGHQVDDLDLIVLTHEHSDHVGLADVIARRSRAEIAALEELERGLRDYDQLTAAEAAHAAALMARHGVPEVQIEAASALLRAIYIWGADAHVTEPLADGELLDLGDRAFRVMHRPGHSEWDTLLYDCEADVLLSGDHLLASVSSIALVPTADPTLAAPRKRPLVHLRNSLKELAELRPRIVLGGHGPVVSDPVALIERRLDEQEQRADALLELVREVPRTAHELATELFGADARAQVFLTTCEVLGHLDLLLERGLVAETVNARVARFSVA
jgi:glyoxylase-like metal-dependent hydrolase (beta-lactamase superfamily II)